VLLSKPYDNFKLADAINAAAVNVGTA
jgi:hypothetical protein